MRRPVIIIAIVGALLVTVLWWLLVLGPRNAAVADVDQQITGAREREASLRVQIARLTDIKDQELSYLFAIGQMEESIPPGPEIDALLDDLNVLAISTGVTLDAISFADPTAPTVPGDPYQIRVSFGVEGQYFEVLGFLYGLEAMSRLMRVDTLAMTASVISPDEESITPPEGEEPAEQDPPERREADIVLVSVSVGAVVFTSTPPPTAEVPTTTTVPPDDSGETTETTVPGGGE